jgi:hypothetical protein
MTVSTEKPDGRAVRKDPWGSQYERALPVTPYMPGLGERFELVRHRPGRAVRSVRMRRHGRKRWRRRPERGLNGGRNHTRRLHTPRPPAARTQYTGPGRAAWRGRPPRKRTPSAEPPDANVRGSYETRRSGADGTRTRGLLAASQTLSQLSYGPSLLNRNGWRATSSARLTSLGPRSASADAAIPRERDASFARRHGPRHPLRRSRRPRASVRRSRGPRAGNDPLSRA